MAGPWMDYQPRTGGEAEGPWTLFAAPPRKEAEAQRPAVGGTWTDPETGGSFRIIDGASLRKPGEVTLADISSRQSVLARQPAREASGLGTVGEQVLEPTDRAALAKAANDQAFAARVLRDQSTPQQRAMATAMLGEQRAMARGPAETFAREAVNGFALGLPRAASALASGGMEGFGPEYRMQLAADAKGRAMNPGAAAAGAAVGGLVQGLALPGAAVATPARAGLTGAALSGVPSFLETGDPAKAMRDAAMGAAIGAGGRAIGYRPPAEAPTREALQAAAREGYEALGKMGVAYGDNAYRDLTGRMSDALRREGFDPDLHPKVRRVMERMHERLGGASLDDLRADRRLLADVGASPDERRLAGLLRREIDGFVDRADPSTMTGASAGEASRLLKDANTNYAAARRSENIADATAKAERMAQRSATTKDTAVRRLASRLLDSDKAMRGFDDAERAAMERVVEGSPATNLARMIGQFGPQNTMATMAAGAGGIFANPALAGIPVAGLAGRLAADAMTSRAMQRVDDMTRLRSALGEAAKRKASDPLDDKKRALVRVLLGVSSTGQDDR